MDKLRIINNALINTGNTRIDTLYDGSDEWQVADAGFDRAIEVLISMHQWPFATRTVTLNRTGDSDDPTYADAYAIPSSVWHFRRLLTAEGTPLSFYTLSQGSVLTTLSGATSILAEVVEEPVADANWHPMAIEVLTLMVESALLRGLNDDERTALLRDDKAEAMLVRAQTRVDQQKPPRRGFRNNISRIRRTRRTDSWGYYPW